MQLNSYAIEQLQKLKKLRLLKLGLTSLAYDEDALESLRKSFPGIKIET